ncbi:MULTISPECIES: metal-sensitive transcriptional regulator [Alteribacter]|uniref:Metal-sensitive transcriptional regulator n=1 Tax=Alteribacter keqinensis TaxID=2483800 RepID=A0A3M7TXX8_9BACI|nr:MULTISPECIES: metal-sensitive transcriptional regulator [Alteribacter]MBM7096316.1 metal-sensitive transcriptional regulator [Alteribacter salitolerans]RNA70458.1 metal-sensitive transcriptional regulator [Alteribacter keqinensis]
MKYSDDMKNRLKRVEGQMRGILRMMEQEKDCKDIITQMTAVRTAVDRATAYIVAKNLEQCLRENTETDAEREEVIEEAIKMLVKSR